MIIKLLKILCVSIIFVGLMPETGLAQPNPCDTCSTPWGPIQQKVYANQTINGLMPHCLYNVYLDIQTRTCNGKIQVRLVDQYIQSLSNDPACNLACFHVGSLMRKISKLLVFDLGGNVVISKPAPCYYLLEFDLTPGLEACLGAEAYLHDHWYAALPCDDNGCCVTEYQAQANGSVLAVTSVSTPCMGTPPSPIPASITVYCWTGGVRNSYVVPVVPPTTPLTCEIACSNTGDVFISMTPTSITDPELSDVPYIYPNPTDGAVYFKQHDLIQKVSVFDIYGRRILTAEGSQTSVNLKDYPSGNYLIIVDQIDGKQSSFTVTKQ